MRLSKVVNSPSLNTHLLCYKGITWCYHCKKFLSLCTYKSYLISCCKCKYRVNKIYISKILEIINYIKLLHIDNTYGYNASLTNYFIKHLTRNYKCDILVWGSTRNLTFQIFKHKYEFVYYGASRCYNKRIVFIL